MTRPRLAALCLAALLLFSACTENAPIEPSVSASVGEYTPPETTFPQREEVTCEATDPPETEPEETLSVTDLTQMKASEIFALSQKLCEKYYAFTRITHTNTEILLDGEQIRSESSSELAFRDGNAVFRRKGAGGDEEYHLVDSFLCFSGALGKYRIGGMNTASFLELFSDLMPIGSFEEGVAEHSASDVVLNFEILTESGKAYLRETLGLLDETLLEVDLSRFTIHTDANGNLMTAAVEIRLTVSSAEKELMKLHLTSEMEQNSIVGIIDLNSPNIADHLLFPNLEAIGYYENAVAQIAQFKANRDAFEFTDRRSTKIGAESLLVEQNSTADYAYASRIGLSIDKRFDVNDGSGMHSLLTHFNKRRAFSQMDGGNIFVDTTVNKDNLFLMTFRPFDSIFFATGDCRSAEIVKDGKITLNLKDSVVRKIAQQILFSSGISADDLLITKINRAATYIRLDENGRLDSVGYELSLRLVTNGKTYDVAQSADITVRSHNSAKVKVIYIDVPEDEE